MYSRERARFTGWLICIAGMSLIMTNLCGVGSCTANEQQIEAQQPDSTKLTPEDRVMVLWNFYRADWGSLSRFYAVEDSIGRHQRLLKYVKSWMKGIDEFNVEQLTSTEANTFEDFRQQLLKDVADLDAGLVAVQKLHGELSFAQEIVSLFEARQRVDAVIVADVAARVTRLAESIRNVEDALQADESLALDVEKIKRMRAGIGRLTEVLKDWYRFYDGYDPLFVWWVKRPYEDVVARLTSLNQALANRTTIQTAPTDENRRSRSRSELATIPPAPAMPVDWLEWPRQLPQVPDADELPDFEHLFAKAGGTLPGVIEAYEAESSRINRRREREKSEAKTGLELCKRTLETLNGIEFESLRREDQVDYVLLKNELTYEVKKSQVNNERRQEEQRREFSPLDYLVAAGIGREALQVDIDHEMIPYSPEELIEIGEREYAWCRSELIRASREMGFGDDWKKAIAHVKGMHVAPGEQPALIRKLANEAIDYLQTHDLISVSPIAKERLCF